jgi:histone deacetylase 1/2
MTVSLHKFGNFFPGTGDPRDVGHGEGKNYSVNFPLQDGVDDATYESIFKPLISNIMDWYKPNAIVIQCGADSLAGDRLGCFNLTLKGHANCVEFVKSYNLPTLVLGGGGYTIKNVARCWAYETSLLLDEEIKDALPYNDYLEYYGPDYRLHIEANNMKNLNERADLEKTLAQLLENLRHIDGAPSVAQFKRPPDHVMNEVHEDDLDPDQKRHQARDDTRIYDRGEFYEGEDNDDKGKFMDAEKNVSANVSMMQEINSEIRSERKVEMLVQSEVIINQTTKVVDSSNNNNNDINNNNKNNNNSNSNNNPEITMEGTDD